MANTLEYRLVKSTESRFSEVASFQDLPAFNEVLLQNLKSPLVIFEASFEAHDEILLALSNSDWRVRIVSRTYNAATDSMIMVAEITQSPNHPLDEILKIANEAVGAWAGAKHFAQRARWSQSH